MACSAVNECPRTPAARRRRPARNEWHVIGPARNEWHVIGPGREGRHRLRVRRPAVQRGEGVERLREFGGPRRSSPSIVRWLRAGGYAAFFISTSIHNFRSYLTVL